LPYIDLCKAIETANSCSFVLRCVTAGTLWATIELSEEEADVLIKNGIVFREV
jgi:hypothetical protein